MTQAKRDKFYRGGGFCAVCGVPMETPQFAHKIADTVANRRKWGSWIIDNAANGEWVCSLKCNDACNIGNNQGKCIELISSIAQKEQCRYASEVRMGEVFDHEMGRLKNEKI